MKNSIVSLEHSAFSSLYLPRRRAAAAIVAGLAVGCSCWLLAPGSLAWASLPLALALAWASAVDIDRYILPDLITLGLVLAGLSLHATDESTALLDASLGAAVGYLAMAGTALIYERVRRRPGLGLGDAKLLAAAGAWLGWKALPVVLLLGSLGALAFVPLIAARAGRKTLIQVLPFGPFLALAFLAAWVAQPWPFG